MNRISRSTGWFNKKKNNSILLTDQVHIRAHIEAQQKKNPPPVRTASVPPVVPQSCQVSLDHRNLTSANPMPAQTMNLLLPVPQQYLRRNNHFTARFSEHATDAFLSLGFFRTNHHSISRAAFDPRIVQLSISTILRSSNFKISIGFSNQPISVPHGYTLGRVEWMELAVLCPWRL